MTTPIISRLSIILTICTAIAMFARYLQPATINAVTLLILQTLTFAFITAHIITHRS